MKRLLSLFLALTMLACLAACGAPGSASGGTQKREYSLTRRYYFDENGDWEKTREYIRNENGDIVVVLRSGLLETVYDYDEEGREIRETDYESDGLTVDNIYETAYDEAGNIVSETHPEGSYLYAEHFYTYDENGYLICKETSNNLGGYNRYDYINDSKGRVIEIQYLQEDGNMGCFSKREYASDGSSVEYYYAESKYNYGIPTLETTGLSAVTCDSPIGESRYDADGLCVYSERYDVSYTVEYTYNADGIMVEELDTDAEGNWVRTSYTLTDSGQTLSELEEDSHGNWTRYYYDRDENDKVLRSGCVYYYPDMAAMGYTGEAWSALEGVETDILDYTNEFTSDGYLMHHTDYWPDLDRVVQFDGEYFSEWTNARGDRLCTLAEADAFWENSGDVSYDEVTDRAMEYIHNRFSTDIPEKDVIWSGISCAYVDYVGGAYMYHVAFYIPGYGAGSILEDPYGGCLDATLGNFVNMVRSLYCVYRSVE